MFEKIKNILKEAPGECVSIFSPLEGEAVPISDVSDPTFHDELVGRGVAVKPAKGRVVAPADGEVSMMFKTGHAVALNLAGGVEVLIHVGLDTVNLQGKHFTTHTVSGNKVKKGDLLIEFDMEAIAADGYDLVTPVVVTNHEEYKDLEVMTGRRVQEGDDLIKVLC